MASAPTYQDGESAQHRFDPNFTDAVINAMGPKVDDRTRFVMSSLIRHLHDFIREVELTNEEWFEGVRFVNSIGKTTTSSRNEAHRISDVLGVESLVDEIAHKHINESGETPTSSTILGPFWSPHSPFRENGDSIITDPHPKGEVTLMHGVVRDLDTKKGIPGAVIDIWQASANGKYDFQDQENQKPNNLRGKFTTNENGEYWYYCYKPTAYSLPMDGAAGQLFRTLDKGSCITRKPGVSSTIKPRTNGPVPSPNKRRNSLSSPRDPPAKPMENTPIHEKSQSLGLKSGENVFSDWKTFTCPAEQKLTQPIFSLPLPILGAQADFNTPTRRHVKSYTHQPDGFPHSSGSSQPNNSAPVHSHIPDLKALKAVTPSKPRSTSEDLYLAHPGNKLSSPALRAATFMYAGPQFHNSPCPAALPPPKFAFGSA